MSHLNEFHDVRFPLRIALGATGGPVLQNEIVTLTSGLEKRNARRLRTRRRFDVGTGFRSLEDLREVTAFFEARRGSLFGFRFRDPFDNSSAVSGSSPSPDDQKIGTGNGAQAVFQLAKSYGDVAGSYSRAITKPVATSVRIAIDGVEQVTGADFTLDALTGEITFEQGSVPPPGAVVTAGFEFDIAARFDSDRIDVSIIAFEAGQIPAIPVVELLS